MTDSDEIRTRGDRDAAVKEAVIEFNKVARGVNRIIQEINFASANPNVEVDELLHYSERYKSTLIELSSLYDRICELSLDLPLLPKLLRFLNALIRKVVKFRLILVLLFVKSRQRKNWLNRIQLKGRLLMN